MPQVEIKNGVQATDDLVAYDASGAAVTGLVNGDWTKKLYNPSSSEVSGSVTVTVTELGFGGYRATWTPNAAGIWSLILTNAANSLAYSATYKSVTGDIDDLFAGWVGKLEITDAGGGTMNLYDLDDALMQAFELYDVNNNRTSDPASVVKRVPV